MRPDRPWRRTVAPALTARQGAKGTRLRAVVVQTEGDAWPTTKGKRQLRAPVVVARTSTRRPHRRPSRTSGDSGSSRPRPIRPAPPRPLRRPRAHRWTHRRSTQGRPARAIPARHSMYPASRRRPSRQPSPSQTGRHQPPIPGAPGWLASTTDPRIRTSARSSGRRRMAGWSPRSSPRIRRIAARRCPRRCPNRCGSRSWCACRRATSTARATSGVRRSRSRPRRRSSGRGGP